VEVLPIEMPPHLDLVEANWVHGKIVHFNNSGDYFMPICPDWIIDMDFYQKIFDIMENLYGNTVDNLLTYCPRTLDTKILPSISEIDELDKDTLIAIGLESLHWTQKHLRYDSDNFAYWASAVWFGDYSARCFHPHPLVMKLNNYVFLGGSVDGYLTTDFDIFRTKFVQPSDIPIFEFSKADKGIALTGKPFNTILFHNFMQHHITIQHLHYFTVSLRFKSGIDVPEESLRVKNIAMNAGSLHAVPSHCVTYYDI